MYIVYILYSSRLDKYYIGRTNDINRRLSEHNRIKGKFTDGGIPWSLVYSEQYDTLSDATQREQSLKRKKSRKYIEQLIQGQSG